MPKLTYFSASKAINAKKPRLNVPPWGGVHNPLMRMFSMLILKIILIFEIEWKGLPPLQPNKTQLGMRSTRCPPKNIPTTNISPASTPPTPSSTNIPPNSQKPRTPSSSSFTGPSAPTTWANGVGPKVSRPIANYVVGLKPAKVFGLWRKLRKSGHVTPKMWDSTPSTSLKRQPTRYGKSSARR